jgi:hypothetical protein
MKVLVSGYQSIYMHCIVMPAKFDAKLSLSDWEKSNSLQKKVPIFKNISHPAIWKKDRLSYVSPWKSPIFLGLHFSCERDRQPVIKFNIDLEVLFIYRLIPTKSRKSLTEEKRLMCNGFNDISISFFSVHGISNSAMRAWISQTFFLLIPKRLGLPHSPIKRFILK